MTKVTRAVLYARVSSDDTKNEGRNLTGQLEMCREYARSKGYHIITELAEDDRGASGANWDLPQLKRLMEMAHQGEFEVLIVREVDRLARNRLKHIVIESELSKCGVRVEYTIGQFEDTTKGRLLKGLVAEFAEFERQKITERMLRGKENKVKSGSVLTMNKGAVYGYRRVEKDGEFLFEINPDEARIVKLIFQWYTVGDEENGPLSAYIIANRLTEMGVLTARDKGKVVGKKKRGRGEWERSTVNYMLRNKTYIGQWQYGKTRLVNGKQVKNTNGDAITVEVPAIIDMETWEPAQEKLAQNKQNSRRNRKYNYLLASRAICGKCFGRIEVTTNISRGKMYQYYRCPAARRNNRAYICDASTHFRGDKVDAKVWEWLTEITVNPDYLKARLKEYQDYQDQVNDPIHRELATIDSLLAENHSRRQRWLEMYETGVIELSELKEKQVGYEKAITGLESRQAELKVKLQDDLTDEVIEDILEFAEIIREEITIVGQDFNKKRRFIELMDVWVRFAIEDGEQVVYVSARMGKRRTEKRLSIVDNYFPRTRRPWP